MTVARWLWRHRRQRAWLLALTGVTAVSLLSSLVVDALVRAAGYEPARYETALLGVALLGFQPLLLSVKLGQTAGLLAGMLSFAGAAALSSCEDPTVVDDEDSGIAVRRRAAVLSGALTALVGLVKLPYAPASAHLLTDRRRLLGGIAAGLALVGLSLAVFGLETNATYLDVLRWGATDGLERRPPTLWLPPYYRPFYLVDSAVGRQFALALRVVLAGGIAALAVRRGGDDAATFAFGAAAVPLLAPQTYTYYLVALVPAALALLPRELRGGGSPSLPVLAVLLAHLHAYGLKLLVSVLSESWLLALLQPGLWGNLLLVGVAGWRISAE
ncbi:MAG: glycosyltransferase 87 family protein [Halolamina sp.]|uniref:glycosyltransferase 87 family protein n=1 Tax=Halolamina sp. TaxID=1940283 RepID=UPI002FC2CC7B